MNAKWISLCMGSCAALLLPGQGIGQQVVAFSDTVLESAVRAELDVPSAIQIYDSDMAMLGSLFTSGVSNLEGLQYATNLNTLVVPNGQITDISPILAVSSIETLELTRNNLAGAFPQGLTGTRGLEISWNQLTDISAVGQMSSLEQMGASYNELTVIPNLSGCTQLVDVYLSYNQISSLVGIDSLLPSSVKVLILSGNPIQDIGPLATLAQIERLGLSDMGLTDIDIEAIASLTSLSSLGLWGNEIVDVTPLGDLGSMQYLGLKDNQIQDISPLVGLDVTLLDLTGNPLNADAYNVYIPQMLAGRPGMTILYDPIPEPATFLIMLAGISIRFHRRRKTAQL